MSSLLVLEQAVAGSETIRFWGACGVGVADGRRAMWRRRDGSGEAVGILGSAGGVDVSVTTIFSPPHFNTYI